jgi:hypothetical protein
VRANRFGRTGPARECPRAECRAGPRAGGRLVEQPTRKEQVWRTVNLPAEP